MHRCGYSAHIDTIMVSQGHYIYITENTIFLRKGWYVVFWYTLSELPTRCAAPCVVTGQRIRVTVLSERRTPAAER